VESLARSSKLGRRVSRRALPCLSLGLELCLAGFNRTLRLGQLLVRFMQLLPAHLHLRFSQRQVLPKLRFVFVFVGLQAVVLVR
jgi:hypothetical protein